MRTKSTRKSNLQGRIETLEPRVVMSADPLANLLGGAINHHAFDDEPPSLVQHVEGTTGDALPPLDQHLEAPPLGQHVQSDMPDFWISEEDQTLLEEEFGNIEQMLSSAHNLTGWNSVNTNYGFDGTGQTIAVIDSGIAYDHYALGGGLGSSYRVVGGWDFTENDADPYDDGPSGSHGTHVAGIIGSSDSTHQGVASGVDMVGLRVFNDAGAGYFSWVESALQWVHDHRNDFANPITAVNMSIGVSTWNAETIPLWANLEDELAQLEADGIFIAVSAGNSYTSYNTTGLSYPAASPHVVPVMSSDDSGLLSYYSQRSTRAIAAPGRGITSTVPDYNGSDADDITNDFRSKSGTSMASPYVAGASALVRQAMEFVGMTNITQDTIYDHMAATADTFTDSSTGVTFNRLNLQNAIDALMPTDDFSSSMVSAYNMGTVGESGMSMNGMIGTLADVDYFTFTAEGSGTVTFATSSTTHDMASNWTAYDSQGATMLAMSGNTAALDVVAGQTYTVGLGSTGGLGYYSFDVTADMAAAFTPEEWGVVAFDQHAGESVASEAWYRVTASQAGYFTALADFSGGGAVSVSIHDAQQNLIAAGTTAGSVSRVDVQATAGQEFLLRVTGTNSDVDVTLANLVSEAGSTVTVAGTAAADAVTFSAGSSLYLTINGVGYGFSTSTTDRVEVNAGGGADTLIAIGTSGVDTAYLSSGYTTVEGSGYTFVTEGFETATVYGGGGADVAHFTDTAGDDAFSAKFNYSKMTGAGYSVDAFNFGTVTAHSTRGGTDSAEMFDTAGDDYFRGLAGGSVMTGAGYMHSVTAFENVYAYSNAGGNDTADMYDSPADDLLYASSDYAYMKSTTSFNFVRNFEQVYAYATAGGEDTAHLVDSPGDDLFIGTPDLGVMSGPGFYNFAKGFENLRAFAQNGGNDRSRLLGGINGDDYLSVRANASWLSGAGYTMSSEGFDDTIIDGRGGNDTAWLRDVAAQDAVWGSDGNAGVTRSTGVTMVKDFTRVVAEHVAGSPGTNVSLGAIDYVFEEVWL